tara:strand:- start:304 stop:420 length:117 start_codon:yes stop_codon:yes gene_type:complete
MKKKLSINNKKTYDGDIAIPYLKFKEKKSIFLENIFIT